MAQKINPLSFRDLKNYEDSFCQQQTYNRSSLPYVLDEHRKIRVFIRRFFKNFNLILHSFKYVKTSQGVAQMCIKYVSSVQRNDKDSIKLVKLASLENAFIYIFSKFFPATPFLLSFMNLDKSEKKVSSVTMKGSPFSNNEMNSYLNVLLTVKGSAFFLSNIISSQLQFMRSRADRKSQARFLVFISNLLTYVYKNNTTNIKGIKVSIHGRINGVPRSKAWSASEGKLSLQRIDTEMDYYYLPSQTVYGTFGVKVWINYGY